MTKNNNDVSRMTPRDECSTTFLAMTVKMILQKRIITVWLVTCLSGLDSVDLLHTNNSIFDCLVESNLLKL